MGRNVLIICLIIFSGTGCQYHDVDAHRIDSANGYLPLQVGNFWELIPLDKSSYGMTRKEVTQRVTINGYEYYQIKSRWDYNSYSSVDSAYYRVTNNGYVYMLKNFNDKESNPFRLDAKEGDHWLYGVDDAVITVTQVESLLLNVTSMNNCKLYAYDVFGWADEEMYTYLAPGIGFATEYTAWGFRRTLKRARINGTLYNF